jgi:hypothetical protein
MVVYVVEIVVGERANPGAPGFEKLEMEGNVELKLVVDANIGLSICVCVRADAVDVVELIAAVDVVDGSGVELELRLRLKPEEDSANKVVEEVVDDVLTPLPGSTSARVLLYVVISTTALPPPLESWRFEKREGNSAIPPHFWAGSPGQGVSHAESGYLTKSESEGVPVKEEQKHSLGCEKNVSCSDFDQGIGR